MVDDDAPLVQLKSATFDDDMPLASLASSAPQKPSKAAAAKAKGKGKGNGKSKAKNKAAAKKSANESSSSSSSGSSSSSDSSEGGQTKTKKDKPAAQAKRMALLKKKRKQALGDAAGDDEEVEEDKEDLANNVVKKRDRSKKQEAVAELLCRWWYALPDWPPTDKEFYAPRLEEMKLRQVTIQEWEWVDEKDSRGFSKVYQLSQFPGVFRDAHGKMIDLRPQETCPCYANFMKKDVGELYDLLATAYAAQLQELETSKYNEDKLRKDLNLALHRVKDKAFQAKEVGGLKRNKTA